MSIKQLKFCYKKNYKRVIIIENISTNKVQMCDKVDIVYENS